MQAIDQLIKQHIGEAVVDGESRSEMLTIPLSPQEMSDPLSSSSNLKRNSRFQHLQTCNWTWDFFSQYIGIVYFVMNVPSLALVTDQTFLPKEQFAEIMMWLSVKISGFTVQLMGIWQHIRFSSWSPEQLKKYHIFSTWQLVLICNSV